MSIWLVVDLPLWKIRKSVGIMTFPIYGKSLKKNVPNHQPMMMGFQSFSYGNMGRVHSHVPCRQVVLHFTALYPGNTVDGNSRILPGIKNMLLLYHHFSPIVYSYVSWHIPSWFPIVYTVIIGWYYAQLWLNIIGSLVQVGLVPVGFRLFWYKKTCCFYIPRNPFHLLMAFLWTLMRSYWIPWPTSHLRCG